MKYRLLIGLLFTFLFLCHCSVEKRYNVLSFFFDGIPVPSSLQQLDSLKLSMRDNSLFAWDSLGSIRRRKVEAARFFHAPYTEEECLSCHKEQFTSNLIKPVEVLCFDCHEKFKEPHVFVHGPVASGNCVLCHDPHYSPYPMRAPRVGDALCNFCHEEIDTTTVQEHKKIVIDDCIDCHDPHFSEESNFLVKMDNDKDSVKVKDSVITKDNVVINDSDKAKDRVKTKDSVKTNDSDKAKERDKVKDSEL